VSSRKSRRRASRLGRSLKTPLILATFFVPAIAGAQVTPPAAPQMASTAPRPISLDEAVRLAELQSEEIRIARA
jgi:hypothetical protein